MDIAQSNIKNPTSLTCTGCKHEIPVYQPDHYQTIACPECYELISKADPLGYKRVKNRWKDSFYVQKLYRTAIIDGQELKVIGIAMKHDLHSRWIEYHLIDKNGESHFLSQWEGHFHYFRELKAETGSDHRELVAQFNPNGLELKHQGIEYTRLSKYKASIDCILGELPYDLKEARDAYTMDFAAPPHIISVEFTKDSESFFVGRYVSEREMKNVFATVLVRPSSGTVGMAQAFFGGINVRAINLFLFFFFCAFTFLHITLISYRTSQTLIRGQYDVTTNSEYVTRSFFLAEKTGSYYLNFQGQTNLNNQWVENQISLINEGTGEERELSLGIEYYSGVDGGYSWSEGSDFSEVHLSGVKPGRYHLRQKFITSDASSLPFSLTVSTDSPATWNYWSVVLVIFLFFVVFNWAHSRFEQRRTGNAASWAELAFKKNTYEKRN